MRNAAIDMQAASDHGVTVCGTGGVVYPTAELTWGIAEFIEWPEDATG